MKFSIRQMLIGMVAMAFYAAVIGAGANGSPVGYGLAVGIAALLVVTPVLAVLYWLAFATVAHAQKKLDQRSQPNGQQIDQAAINTTSSSIERTS